MVASCDHFRALKFSKALPHVFTEHGAVMLASVRETLSSRGMAAGRDPLSLRAGTAGGSQELSLREAAAGRDEAISPTPAAPPAPGPLPPAGRRPDAGEGWGGGAPHSLSLREGEAEGRADPVPSPSGSEGLGEAIPPHPEPPLNDVTLRAAREAAASVWSRRPGAARGPHNSGETPLPP